MIRPARTGAFVACLLLAAVPADAAPILELSSELRIGVPQGRGVELLVRVDEETSPTEVAERVTGSRDHAKAIRAWNDGDATENDPWLRVPLALLSEPVRALVLRSLFPADRRDGDDWIHVARSGELPLYDEGLWQVAEWFTGRGDRFIELMRENGLSSPELRRGQEIRIPGRLLHPAFHTRLRSDDGQLEYSTDDDGPYAAYRIRRGEALYSSVVVRFTGRTGSEDVATIAERIAERSAIRDPRDIPVGYEIRIPFDLLEPNFLPAGHPRRLEADELRAELASELSSRPLAGTRGGLEGVLVVIDPGHGGRDIGTSNHGVWEHDYVYDVACRLKRMLERETAATVLMTLEDEQTGCEPSNGDRLVVNHQGTIRTQPPFLARKEGEAAIGVNLRWYLANSWFRKARSEGGSADRVVFLSLHADSRHPSLRGAMVYVPGAEFRTRTYGSSSGTYKRYAEVREKPFVKFSRKERVRSEALSLQLGEALLAGLRTQSIPVQPYQPIRNKIIRGRQQWVPAVLRGNAIPTKVLVEMVNLSNRSDAALLASAQQRQQLARGLLNGLFGHFGERPGAVTAKAAPR